MQFTKILGKVDRKIIDKSETQLSAVFTELAINYERRNYGSKIGGDAVIYQLVYPQPHIADCQALEFDAEIAKIKSNAERSIINEQEKDLIIKELKSKFGNRLLRTAATNGKVFYWAPQFINSLSLIGVRLVVGHEAWHGLYMHPSRRGSRNPGLWNIAVDFKVNFTLMEDLKARGFYQPDEIFKKELGNFVTLEEYASFLKDPFNPPAKLASWNPIHSLRKMANPGYQDPNNKNEPTMYYAEPKLSDTLKKPENIYEYLWSSVPVCKTCGKRPAWHKSKEYKKLVEKINEQKQQGNET